MFKKTIPVFLICVFLAGIACADNMPTEEDYKNLAEMRAKLVRMKREMDHFIRDIMDTYPAQGGISVAGFGEEVKIDISETAKDVMVKADLPGMDKDKIEVALTNNKILKISGSRDMEAKEERPGMVRQERMSGKFERILELPVDCMTEGIKASYKNGVLELIIPKKEEAKESMVKIRVQ